MTNRYHIQNWLKQLLLIAVLLLTGCHPWDESETTATSSQIGGSVGDGPVTGATVTVYSAAGNVLGTVQSDSGATFRSTIKTRGKDYPLRLVAIGGTDLVTGNVPDFEMVSVVTHPSHKNANINPYSTLIVKAAESMPGGLSAANVGTAQALVMDNLGFGLDSNVIPDPITTVIDNSNVAHIVKASEILGEMVRRTRDLVAGSGTPVDGDSVMESLADDLADGVFDGQGGPAADPTMAAVASVVSGQVLLEAVSNSLKVGGAIATAVIDQSIVSTHAGVSGAELTDNILISRNMLDQLAASLAAIQVIDNSQAVANIVATVAGLPANVLPASIASALPVSNTGTLDNALNLVPVATQAEIDAVNQVVVSGGGNPGPGNSAPLIGGSPSATVVANNSYSFQSTASDADGDSLIFNIVNKPSWASFNSATGRLSGTPGDQHVGSYSNIAISVTDGTDTASLSDFAIQVSSVPVVNTAPVISGSPAASVFSNTGYVFQPSAADANGDSLTFSIVNKPSWASFNSGTGRLSGTPADQHAGTYSNIVISVSDGLAAVSLSGFSIQVVPAPVVNTPPVISGSAGGLVTAGNGYLFQPFASDADGDSLTFSIANKPSWASFNTGNGVLSGTPGSTDTGSYGNIVIAVSDGTDTTNLPGFSIQVDPAQGSFALGWTAPLTRADGSPLSLSSISEYRVYYGTTAGNYTSSVSITNGSATSTVINNIPTGSYHIVMTTVDTTGLESAQSPSLVKVAN